MSKIATNIARFVLAQPKTTVANANLATSYQGQPVQIPAQEAASQTPLQEPVQYVTPAVLVVTHRSQQNAPHVPLDTSFSLIKALTKIARQPALSNTIKVQQR